jgi:hypothetical protein
LRRTRAYYRPRSSFPLPNSPKCLEKQFVYKPRKLGPQRNNMVLSVWTAAGEDENGSIVRGRMSVELKGKRVEIDRSKVRLEEIRDISN